MTYLKSLSFLIALGAVCGGTLARAQSFDEERGCWQVVTVLKLGKYIPNGGGSIVVPSGNGFLVATKERVERFELPPGKTLDTSGKTDYYLRPQPRDVLRQIAKGQDLTIHEDILQYNAGFAYTVHRKKPVAAKSVPAVVLRKVPTGDVTTLRNQIRTYLTNTMKGFGSYKNSADRYASLASAADVWSEGESAEGPLSSCDAILPKDWQTTGGIRRTFVPEIFESDGGNDEATP